MIGKGRDSESAPRKRKGGKRKARGLVPKSTQAAAHARRRAVEDLYRRGVHVDDIVDQLLPKFPSANKRNVEGDIHLIRERWREQVRFVFDDDVRSWFVFSALDDRARAIKEGDLKLAYAIARDIAKLAGVNLSDLTVDDRRSDAGRAMSWLELMQAERARKQLPAADFVVVEDEQAGDG